LSLLPRKLHLATSNDIVAAAPGAAFAAADVATVETLVVVDATLFCDTPTKF
jgi:hypothetical protein